ncbi:hypothetical protein OUZ56_004103 [Daphnia magna]|uniref:Carbonic anhydrase n=1 Tax=Daphnia magna TaxID=35525 RepID=A0ABQ9YNW8_9CRUS|nr:hypothetical protein OUZ56_004103 [Daphnia magna]
MAQNWGYKSTNGPHTWAEHYAEAAGQRQSPIDIQTSDVTLDPRLSSRQLTWNWPKHTDDVTNTGYCWKAHIHGEGSTLQGGPLKDTYQLEQYHCHWGVNDSIGSEHTVDGKSYAGELHFVHWNTKYGSFGEALKHGDGLAVLGVFVEAGKEHGEANNLIRALNNIKFKDETVKFADNLELDPSKLMPSNEPRPYWTYLGSLTTPPCSECVIWIVFKDPIQMSHEQLEAFRAMYCGNRDQCCAANEMSECILTNFRPCLPRGDRCVRASYN